MLEELTDCLRDMLPLAVGYSGGVDSALLAFAASRIEGEVRFFHVLTGLERDDAVAHARNLAVEIGIRLEEIRLDMFSVPEVASNDFDRCYHCKRSMFSAIREAAPGYTVVDGTNASDPEDERPGMKALRELGVRSPLRECGITKDDVRSISREEGLSVWDRPSDSCRATRVRTGVVLTPDILDRVSSSEDILHSMGFGELRVRTDGFSASVVMTSNDRARAEGMMDAISRGMGCFFSNVVLDPDIR